MTCFWSAILQTLNHQDKQLLQLSSSAREADIVNALKKTIINNNHNNNDVNVNAIHCLNHVLWQGQSLSPKFISECYEWIRDYNVKGIYGGHLTSSCDPFLILLCGILGWNIQFHYQRAFIQYTNNNHNHMKNKRTVRFGGNSHHFYRN